MRFTLWTNTGISTMRDRNNTLESRDSTQKIIWITQIQAV